MEVHAADVPMPVTCGWHPWWYRTPKVGAAPLEVELHADTMYARDDESIPTGELIPVHAPPWDDCFTGLGDPVALLTWPDTQTVRVDTDCGCVVVFTEPEHAICVEPQSGPPDAVNLDVATVVTPGHAARRARHVHLASTERAPDSEGRHLRTAAGASSVRRTAKQRSAERPGSTLAFTPARSCLLCAVRDVRCPARHVAGCARRG